MLSIAGPKFVKIQNLFENNGHIEEIRVSEYLYQAENNFGFENYRHSRKTRTPCEGISSRRESSSPPENLLEGRTTNTQHNHKENTQPDDISYDCDGPMGDSFSVDSVDVLSSVGDCVLVENKKMQGGPTTKRAFRNKKVAKNLEKGMAGGCIQLVAIGDLVAEPTREEQVVAEGLDCQTVKSTTQTYKEMSESVKDTGEKFCVVVSGEFSCGSVSRVMTPVESECSDFGNERLRFEESDQGTPKLPENASPDHANETRARTPAEDVYGDNDLFESCESVPEMDHLSSDVSLVTAECALGNSESVLADDTLRHCSSVSVIAVPCLAFSSFTAMSIPEEDMFSHTETHSKSSNDSDKSMRASKCGLSILNDDSDSKKFDPAENVNRVQRKRKNLELRRKLNSMKRRQLNNQSTNQARDESNQIGTETLNIIIINHEIPILNQEVVDNNATCSNILSDLDQHCHPVNSALSSHTENCHPADSAPSSCAEICHPVDFAPSSCTEICHPVDFAPSSCTESCHPADSASSSCTEVLACEGSESVQDYLVTGSDPTDHQQSPEIPVSHKALRSLDKLYHAARRTAEPEQVLHSSTKRSGRRLRLTGSRGRKLRHSAEKSPAAGIIKSDKRKSKPFRGKKNLVKKAQKKTAAIVESENEDAAMETENVNSETAIETESSHVKITRRRNPRKANRKTVVLKSTGPDSEEEIQTIGELQRVFSNADSGEHSNFDEYAHEFDSLTDSETGLPSPRYIVELVQPVALPTAAELTEPETETRKAAGGKSLKRTGSAKSARSATASAPTRPTQSSSTPALSTSSQLRSAKRDNKKHETATKSQIQKYGIITPPKDHITKNESGDVKFSSTIMKAIKDLTKAGCTDIYIHFYQRTENSLKKVKLKVDIGSNPVRFIPVGCRVDASDSQPPAELPAPSGSGRRKRKPTWERSRSKKQMKDSQSFLDDTGRKKDGDSLVVTPNEERNEPRLSLSSSARWHSSVNSSDDFVSLESASERYSTANSSSSSKKDGQSTATFMSSLQASSPTLTAEQPSLGVSSSAEPDIRGAPLDQSTPAGPVGGGGRRNKRGSRRGKSPRSVRDGPHVCLEVLQQAGPTQGQAAVPSAATVSEAPVRLWRSQDISIWLLANGFDKIVADFSTFEGPSLVELMNRVSRNSETITNYFHSLGLSLSENMRLCSCLNSLANRAAL